MEKLKSKQNWEWYREGDIQHGLGACSSVLKTGFLAGMWPSVVEQAMALFLLVNLNDLLQKMNHEGHRLSASNDIHPVCKANDITDLINNARNAACHINSGQHLMESNKLVFNVVRGYVPSALSINGASIGCDYADDTALIFGANRVYVRRHITQAYGCAKAYYAAIHGIVLATDSSLW